MQSLTRVFRRVEDGLLVTLFVGMVGIAVYQIVARNLFGTGLQWGDSLVRISVLWVTLIGAMVATRADEHIRIDLVARYLSPRWLAIARRLTALFAVVVCGVFVWFSVQFVVWEYVDEIKAVGPIPAWACEVIMPVAFAVIGLRYLLLLFAPTNGTVAPTHGDDNAS